MEAIVKPVQMKDPWCVSSILTSTQATGAWAGRNRTEGYDRCVLLVGLEVQERVKVAKKKNFKNDFNRLRGSLRCLHRKRAESSNSTGTDGELLWEKLNKLLYC